MSSTRARSRVHRMDIGPNALVLVQRSTRSTDNLFNWYLREDTLIVHKY